MQTMKTVAGEVNGMPVEVTAHWKLDFDGVTLCQIGEPEIKVTVGRKVLTDQEITDRFGDEAFRKLIQQVLA
ncbi:hypothetical protein [Paracoccus sp. (in: a-proteobacteria)]|uniref:hypothetical protein n=1 Tax=Paracoccus sp. TaxID=267 RepID=UPI00405887D0